MPMGFSRQEYWSGLPFPSPGDLPDPGIKPGSSPLQADSLPTELWRKSIHTHTHTHTHTHIYIYVKEIYLEEFSSLFMEAEKFHSVLPTRYKARKASGIIQSQSEGLWTREAGGVNPSWKEGENEEKCSISSSKIGKIEKNSSFLCFLFHLGPQQIGWCLPTLGKAFYFIKSSIQMLISSRNTLMIQPEIMFNLDAPWPIKLAHKISHHSGRATSWTAA